MRRCRVGEERFMWGGGGAGIGIVEKMGLLWGRKYGIIINENMNKL